ncbi:Asp-tRNA(Asn)/Glu-tRNA(Gln) amidotransferase subunit GatA [Pontibacter sp. G13]|uniref:Asp-tRNA(Asn)/Glu-tRNA(Gln) amidotransferase subunit GatA n=1 Tax=Pontibacter sp. G13 TaxID=3074898 RepID=UPI002889070C|nr:Asp-tRNA(Asn)/Glu-tRNA(Gln) amidotransferase subunit GatA [Pontibacter sp. G13]WNJ19946.1 Asp-tRNA(Asn)/Glu-tRNA(Gln) amidotransferase subunit GatA [Pontibacter sp. G13]
MKSYKTLADIQRDLSTGSVSCIDLVDLYLGRIEAQPHLNLFIEVFADEARQRAQLIDQKLAEGTAGKLAGLVIGIKDVLCYQGHGLTASSRMLEGFDSMFTGTAVQRLLDEDAIIIGRQNCDEFAMGSSNENSHYGPARNPVDPDRVPGGSSGASAAAVAAGMCHASLGSDTGGSVRQPAAFCGTVGLKPTYGRISRWGLIAYASSFDQIGPLTQSVEDAALLLSVMAGPDGHDQTAASESVEAYETKLSISPKKIGYLKEAWEHPSLSPEIRAQLDTSIAKLEAEGHEVVPVEFELLEYVVPCYYLLTTAEASSNLARYDGVRYGHRSESAQDLSETYLASRNEGFGQEVKRRILLGTFVLSAGYYDAYYTQAMKTRRLLRDGIYKLFQSCDALLLPTTPSTAFRIGEKSEDPIEMYLSDIYTVLANLTGVPAISVPFGTDSQGLPIGVQFMGRPFEESTILGLGQQLAQS